MMSTKKIKVLLVEDDMAWADYFRDAVMVGVADTFDFIFAADLKSALEAVEGDASIQLILLDLMLPDSEAYNTIEVMSARVKFKPIVVLSTLADEKIIQLAMQSGMQDYLVKDEYDDKLFIHVVKQAIRRELHKASQNALRDLDGVRQQLQRVFDTLNTLDPS